MSEERLKHIENKIDHLEDKFDERLRDLEKDLAKYRGMVGGVLLVVSALVAFFKLAWGWLSSHISWS